MEIPEEVFGKFKRIVNRAAKSARSDFYKKKFEREKFNPETDLNGEADIKRVPRLTRDELARTSPFDRLYSDPEDVKYIRYTSGTSGSQALLLFRPEQRYGIPGKKPLIITSNNHLDSYFFNAPRSAEPPYYPPLIHYSPSMAATAVLSEIYGIDAIVGLPSRMLAIGEFLSENLRRKIEFLFIQGEKYTKELSDSLKKLYPNAAQDPRYGMSEVGLFGYQCAKLQSGQKGFYHCEPDYLLEICDPETGRAAIDGEEGEITVSELYESPNQIIRYRTGDVGRVVSAGKCACGASLVFEVTGRIEHDIIKIAGGIIRTDEVERVVKELDKFVNPDFRGVVENTRKSSSLTLYLIPRKDSLITPEMLEGLISDSLFLTASKTLSNFLKEGRLSQFKVLLVDRFPEEQKAQRLKAL